MNKSTSNNFSEVETVKITTFKDKEGNTIRLEYPSNRVLVNSEFKCGVLKYQLI